MKKLLFSMMLVAFALAVQAGGEECKAKAGACPQKAGECTEQSKASCCPSMKAEQAKAACCPAMASGKTTGTAKKVESPKAKSMAFSGPFQARDTSFDEPPDLGQLFPPREPEPRKGLREGITC